MATGIGPTAGTSAVKNALKYCREHPCECLADAINRLLNGHDTPQGFNKGIMARIAAMLAPGANPPGTIFNGKDTWATHSGEIAARQRSLDNLMEEYNAQGCGGGGNGIGVVDLAAVEEAQKAKIPTAEDYWNKFPDRKPASDGPGFWGRVGYGVLGTGLLVGAGVLLFVPFDGPVGEYAAGAAGLGAWGLATQ